MNFDPFADLDDEPRINQRNGEWSELHTTGSDKQRGGDLAGTQSIKLDQEGWAGLCAYSI